MRKINKVAAGLVCAMTMAGLSVHAGEVDSLKLHYDPSVFSDGANGGGEFEAYDLSTPFSFAAQQGTPPSLATAVIGHDSSSNPIYYGTGTAYDPNNGKTTFQTFCTEDTVFFTPDTLYYTQPGLTNHAGIALPSTVAYLFDQFWNGKLIGYDYLFDGGRTTSATDLQQAIWTLMGDPNWTKTATFTPPALDAQSQAWITLADTETTGLTPAFAGIGDVRILQLSGNPSVSGDFVQDQLVEINDTTTTNLASVPLPSAAWGGMAILGGYGVMTLRRRSPVAVNA